MFFLMSDAKNIIKDEMEMISMPTPSPTPDEIISCYLASFNIEMIPNIIGCAAAATIA